MLFTLWPRKRAPRSTDRTRSSFRPQLEALEGRDVPSTLLVRSLDGFGFVTGPLTLRGAIAAAQNGDTIVFDQSLFTYGHQTLQLTSGAPYGAEIELAISKDLTIQGPGGGLLLEALLLPQCQHFFSLALEAA